MFLLQMVLAPVHAVSAVEDWCDWASIDAGFYGKIGNLIAIEQLYMFGSQDCQGSTCALKHGDGVSVNATDNRPTQGVAYE